MLHAAFDIPLVKIMVRKYQIYNVTEQKYKKYYVFSNDL